MAALLTLAFIVEEDQLNLIRLDPEMLQIFLDYIRGAVVAKKKIQSQFTVDELLAGLCALARNEFNRILMVTQGQCSTNEHSRGVIPLVHRTAKGRDNRHLI